MVVTATEFKQNLGKYLDAASQGEEIIISKKGSPVARLEGIHLDRMQAMKSLFGILPSTVTVEEARELRGEQKWGLS